MRYLIKLNLPQSRGVALGVVLTMLSPFALAQEELSPAVMEVEPSLAEQALERQEVEIPSDIDVHSELLSPAVVSVSMDSMRNDFAESTKSLEKVQVSEDSPSEPVFRDPVVEALESQIGYVQDGVDGSDIPLLAANDSDTPKSTKDNAPSVVLPEPKLEDKASEQSKLSQSSTKLGESANPLNDKVLRPSSDKGALSRGLNTTEGMVQWLLSTIAILGVIFLLAFLLKKSRLVQRSMGSMQVESQIALGPKERLVRVNANGRRLLLGVTAYNVNLIMDVTESQVAPANPALSPVTNDTNTNEPLTKEVVKAPVDNEERPPRKLMRSERDRDDYEHRYHSYDYYEPYEPYERERYRGHIRSRGRYRYDFDPRDFRDEYSRREESRRIALDVRDRPNVEERRPLRPSARREREALTRSHYQESEGFYSQYDIYDDSDFDEGYDRRLQSARRARYRDRDDELFDYPRERKSGVMPDDSVLHQRAKRARQDQRDSESYQDWDRGLVKITPDESEVASVASAAAAATVAAVVNANHHEGEEQKSDSSNSCNCQEEFEAIFAREYAKAKAAGEHLAALPDELDELASDIDSLEEEKLEEVGAKADAVSAQSENEVEVPMAATEPEIKEQASDLYTQDLHADNLEDITEEDLEGELKLRSAWHKSVHSKSGDKNEVDEVNSGIALLEQADSESAQVSDPDEAELIANSKLAAENADAAAILSVSEDSNGSNALENKNSGSADGKADDVYGADNTMTKSSGSSDGKAGDADGADNTMTKSSGSSDGKAGDADGANDAMTKSSGSADAKDCDKSDSGDNLDSKVNAALCESMDVESDSPNADKIDPIKSAEFFQKHMAQDSNIDSERKE